jgi:SIT family siderophore-iron:H+ symporter-like MFS transporter
VKDGADNWWATANIQGGIGSAIGGAIWTNVLPGEIARRFAPFQNETLEALAYNNPLGMAVEYPMGTPERLAIGAAQDHAQRIMVISGLSVVAVALVTSIFLLDDLKLTDEQSLSDEDQRGEKDGQKAFTFYGARKKTLHTTQVNNEVIA